MAKKAKKTTKKAVVKKAPKDEPVKETKFVFCGRLRHNGVVYEPGTEFHGDKGACEYFMSLGVLEKV